MRSGLVPRAVDAGFAGVAGSGDPGRVAERLLGGGGDVGGGVSRSRARAS